MYGRQVSNGLGFGLGFLFGLFGYFLFPHLCCYCLSHSPVVTEKFRWAYVLFHAICLCIPPCQLLLPLQTSQPSLTKGVEPPGLVWVAQPTADALLADLRWKLNCLPSGNKRVRVQSLLVNFDMMIMIWQTCHINRVDSSVYKKIWIGCLKM